LPSKEFLAKLDYESIRLGKSLTRNPALEH